MFAALNVSQLIADDLGSVDLGINISVRVTIYPDINPTFSDEIIKIICESRIERTPLVMRGHQRHSREMMSHHYNMLCITLRNTLLDELQTLPVLVIEVARHKRFSAISDLIEVAHTLPDGKLIGRINL